jgi:hypothetical protein
MEAEEEQEKSKTKRPTSRRDLVGQVDKLVKDNFKSWGARQVDCILREGLTLRQTLHRDKADHNKGEIKMGKNYYAAIRKLFEDIEAPCKKLKVQHNTDYENEKLKAALYELTHHRCNMKPFLSFLEEDVVDNQRTVVAVLKASLDIKPESGPKQTNLIVEVMRWCIRNSVHTNFVAEVVSGWIGGPSTALQPVWSWMWGPSGSAWHATLFGLMCLISSTRSSASPCSARPCSGVHMPV